MKVPRLGRRVPPVHSPLSAKSILSAIGASRRPDAVRDELTALLSQRYGSLGVLLVDSGTSALAIAIEAAGPSTAIPAFCCFDIATACDAAGVAPILYDVDPRTLAPDLESLRRALGMGARAVVVVHLYGLPVSLGEVKALAAEAGALIIEDAAQATGASIDGRRAGSLGSYGVLSFGRGKGVTGGGGGALLLNDEAAVLQLRASAPQIAAGARLALRDVVATAAQWALSRPSLYGVPAALPFLRLGDTVYRPPHPPSAISAFSAALAARSLSLEDAEADERRARAARLRDGLSEAAAITVPRAEGGIAGYLRLPLLLEDLARRERLLSRDAQALGILPSYPRTLSDLEGFGPRSSPAGDLPGARSLTRRLFTAPSHRQLDPSAESRLIKLVQKV